MSVHVLSIAETPLHPNATPLFKQLGWTEDRVNSQRKGISAIKKRAPDLVVCEFFYGYGNNYAGVNVSNLDVMLYSLQRYAPEAKVIVLVDKTEQEYIAKLETLFTLDSVLIAPVSPETFIDTLQALGFEPAN